MKASNKQHNAVADKLITVDDIMRYKPCQEYPEERISQFIHANIVKKNIWIGFRNQDIVVMSAVKKRLRKGSY